MPDPRIKITADYQSNVSQGADRDKRKLDELANAGKEVSSSSSDAEKAIARFKNSIAGVNPQNYVELSKAAKQLKNDFANITGADKLKKAFATIENPESSMGQLSSAVKTIESEYSRSAAQIEASERQKAQAVASSEKQIAQALQDSQRALASNVKQIQAEDRQYARDHARIAKENAEATKNSNKESATSFNDFKSALKSMDFPLKNFAKSLLRIAKLRLLRGIIRSITGAFKEGLSNIYQYSAAMNNMDASHMKGNLDELASSLLYMKNAVASAVAPLIASLVPIIAQVANWFVTAASAVAQFFAALGGSTTYTRAKKEAVEWGKVESSAGGAAAAAQEYKNTILGFDEIHALNDVPENGGGGGGGGADAPDYANMFEEAEVSQSVKDLVKWIKDHMDDILDVAKAIGAVLLTWKLSKALSSFFDGLGIGKNSGLRKALKFATGLAIEVVGVQLSFKGGYDIGYEGADVMNVLKTVIGVAFGAFGGYLMASAIGVSGVAGVVVGIGITLSAAIVGFQLGQYDALIDSTYKTSEAFDNYSATMNVLNGILSDNGQLVTYVDGVTKDYAQTAADIAEARTLIGYIEELNNPINRSAIDTEKLKTYTEQLNELGLDGITAQFNEESGMVEFSTDKVNEHLDALLQTAKTEAYLDILKEAWKAEAKAVIDSGIAEETFASSNQATQDAIATMNQYLEEHYGLVDAVSWSYGDAGLNMSTAAANALNVDNNLVILQKTIEDNIDATNKSADAWKAEQDELSTASSYAADAEQAYRNLKDGIDVATVSVGEGETATNAYDSVLKGIAGTTKGTAKEFSYYGIQVDTAASKKFDGKNVTKGMNDVKKSSDDAKGAINGVGGAVDKTTLKSPSFRNIRSGFQNVSSDANSASSSVWGLGNAVDGINGKSATLTITANTVATAALDVASRIRRSLGFALGGFVPGFADGGLIPSFATGGVNSASLFMAHENGAPEMVGRIGNHTAVANTSQMVDAMAQGVYRAMSEVMGSNQGNVEVNVTLDGQRIARAVDNANRVRNRRFNVQA